MANLSTGLAWNNFDRFVDTTSGKDTLHDTVGFIFQNVENSSDANLTQNAEQNPKSKSNESITENEEISNDTRHSNENSMRIRNMTLIALVATNCPSPSMISDLIIRSIKIQVHIRNLIELMSA